MKITGRKVLALVLSLCTMSSLLGACGDNIGGLTGDDALNIRVFDGGYGIEWAEEVAKAFQTKTGIRVSVKGSALRNQLSAEMKTTEAKNQKYDLYLTDIRVGEDLLVNIADVYEYIPEGETMKIGDKFHDDVDAYYRKPNGAYYYSPWGVGATTITYNADVITDDMVPNTTNEMIALCDSFKEQGKYSFIFGNDGNYWERPYMNWWAQYDGIEKYQLYYQGKTEADGIYTTDIFYSQGKLLSLELCETFLGYENGYTLPASTTYGFMTAQKNYFEGKALMMVNGSWLESEMDELFPNGCPFTIKGMKYPIISQIIDRLPTIEDDATLSAVVDYVDGKAGATIPAGVSNDDVEEVRAARNIYAAGPGHQACIPKNAQHIENAKTFLKYMYSKEGTNVYLQHSNGATLFTVEEEYDESWLSQLTPLQRSVLEILNSPTVKLSAPCVSVLTTAGLSYRESTVGLELLYCSQNEKDRMTAREVWQYDIDYYMNSDGLNWNTLLRDAGID